MKELARLLNDMCEAGVIAASRNGSSMNEVLRRFERQAEWQKARQTLPWPEKVRLAEKLRESIRQLRAAPLSQKNPNVHPDHAH